MLSYSAANHSFAIKSQPTRRRFLGVSRGSIVTDSILLTDLIFFPAVDIKTRTLKPSLTRDSILRCRWQPWCGGCTSATRRLVHSTSSVRQPKHKVSQWARRLCVGSIGILHSSQSMETPLSSAPVQPSISKRTWPTWRRAPCRIA